MPKHEIKKASDLTTQQIRTILEHWEVDEWISLTDKQFSDKFKNSEFHLLLDSKSDMLSVARINVEFQIRIQNKNYSFPELVGLVSVIKMNGYGRQLLESITTSLRERNIEAIGFCEKELRSFYEKCNIEILYNQAKQLRESDNGNWTVPADDDILNLTLSNDSKNLLSNLSQDNLGYIV